MPAFENHAAAIRIATAVSILIHAALLWLLRGSFPHLPEPEKDVGVSIDLAYIEPAPPQKAPQAHAAADQAPAREAKPRPKRQARRPQTQAAMPKTATGQDRAITPQGTESGQSSHESAPVKNPANPPPVYPELARKRGQEGTVRVRCQVDAGGLVVAVSLAQGSGHKLLDEAALKTAAKWRFKPALKNGQAVAGSVIVPVEFRLR